MVEKAREYATRKTDFRRDVLKEVNDDDYDTRHKNAEDDWLAGYRAGVESVTKILWRDDIENIEHGRMMLANINSLTIPYVTGKVRKVEGKTRLVTMPGSVWMVSDMIKRYVYLDDLT